jgi:hypothetical protein
VITFAFGSYSCLSPSEENSFLPLYGKNLSQPVLSARIGVYTYCLGRLFFCGEASNTQDPLSGLNLLWAILLSLIEFILKEIKATKLPAVEEWI